MFCDVFLSRTDRWRKPDRVSSQEEVTMAKKGISAGKWIVPAVVAIALLSVAGGSVASQFSLSLVGGVQSYAGLQLTGVGIAQLAEATLDVTSSQSMIAVLRGPSRGYGVIGFYGGSVWKGQIGYGDVCGCGLSGLSGAMGICSYTGPATMGTADLTTLFVTSSGNVGIGVADPTETLHVFGNVRIEGDLRVTGTKNFVQHYPNDANKEIVYTSLEGPEVGTYVRGTAELINGQAEIVLPEHFGLITSQDGCTVQLTPLGEWLQLFVVEKSVNSLLIYSTSERPRRRERSDYT